MTYKTFYKLCHDAEDAPNEEMFIAEPGWADWMDEYGDDTDKLIADMRNIYTVANMSIRDIIKAVGMTQTLSLIHI